MSHQTFSWNSHKETLFGQYWSTDSENPKAVITIVHGHGELSDRYEHVATFFNEHDIHAIAYDHFGHGKSSGKRGHIPSYEAVMDTLDEVLNKAKEIFPSLPIFLYGHSMGGNFVASYAMNRKPNIQGIILSAPWLRLGFQPSAVDLLLAKMMLNIYPSFTQASKLNPQHISRDAEEVQKYIDHPAVHSSISPVLFMGCHRAGEKVLAHPENWKYPLLLMHGTEDKLTSFEASKEFANHVPEDRISWKAWEGFYHELHHEPGRKEVLEMVVNWLETQLE